MKSNCIRLRSLLVCLALVWVGLLSKPVHAANYAVLSWNNLGMHCMDSDYSVFSILPPYNTIHAQIVAGGKLVTNLSGYQVTYQAVADPDGSINTTSKGKGNFYSYVSNLFGASIGVDAGLAGFGMPGPKNTPQPFTFDPPLHWFRAEGIPIYPYDDAGNKNPYPMMRVIALLNGKEIATNDIVLPVSDEMDCRICHGSGSKTSAKPSSGWVWNENPDRDYRLNILRKHDELQFLGQSNLYAAALAARGYPSDGLYASVVRDSHPVLCASCHASEALGTASFDTVPPLTASMHSWHANVEDPELGVTLDNAVHRSACYRCHPGSATRCLRGAMGGAIAADGSMAMQCQSCHGSMKTVGSSTRTGWLEEPNCQSCHTGTALKNNGAIRYTSVFESDGTMRHPVDSTFATTPDTPVAGTSLYRYSAGHGGLQCEACHGSTHAEFPSLHRNDNLRNLSLQGHVGVTVECLTCHTTTPNTVTGGPHGMHPIGQSWVNQHGDRVEGNSATRAQCRACHGLDYKGTVLSRTQADRTFTTDGHFGTKRWPRGRQVGCYDCHNGPSNEDSAGPPSPQVTSVSASTVNNLSVSLPLTSAVSHGNAMSFRMISQPQRGSVGLSNAIATYFPEPGFVGSESFTFVASDGFSESNLGTGVVSVVQGPVGVAVQARVPFSAPLGWPVLFRIVTSVTNSVAQPQTVWNFGDGSPLVAGASVTHVYETEGAYDWSATTSVQSGSQSAESVSAGSVEIDPAVVLQFGVLDQQWYVQWPYVEAASVLEWSPTLGPESAWKADAHPVFLDDALNSTVLGPLEDPQGYFRLRRL